MTGDNRTGHVEVEIGPALAHIDRLQADRRHRDSSGQFFVEGVRNLAVAVERGFPVVTLVASEKLLKSAPGRSIARQLRGAGTPFARASPEQFRSISRAERASGVGAVLRQRVEPLHRIAPRRGLCWVVLRSVRSPGNFGSLVRTSAAVGGAGFILLGAPPLIVLGDERGGLDSEQRALCHELVHIPMVGGVDSLNLAVAGGILMYEVMRRSLRGR